MLTTYPRLQRFLSEGAILAASRSRRQRLDRRKAPSGSDLHLQSRARHSERGRSVHTTLGVYNASGTLLALNDDVGWTGLYTSGIGGLANVYNSYSFIEFTPTVTGTYYLATSTFDAGPDSHVGDYVLSAFAGDLPSGNNTPAMLQVGGSSLTSTLEQSGDTDGFKVATVVGEYYTVLVTTIASPVSVPAPSVSVRDTNGNVIAGEPNFYDFITHVTFQATSSTTWFDVASHIPGLDVGQYSIHIEEASLTDTIEKNALRSLPALRSISSRVSKSPTFTGKASSRWRGRTPR